MQETLSEEAEEGATGTCAAAPPSWCCAPTIAILLRTRPPKGLLGGMAEAPTSAWEPDYEPSRAMLDAPIEARWQRLPGVVRHVFTHFPLELTVFLARVPKGHGRAPGDMRWTPRGRPRRGSAAGAMRKVLVHALGDRARHPSAGAECGSSPTDAETPAVTGVVAPRR